MTEPAKASTQYGDLDGTIAIDGYNGLTVDALIQRADIPKGYCPIGLRIYGFSRDKTGPSVKAKVLCVDTDQTGPSPDDIRRFGSDNGELHTFEFDAEVDLSEFTKLVKRYDVVLLSRITRGIEVKVQPIRD